MTTNTSSLPAHPSTSGGQPLLHGESDLEAVTAEVAAFPERFRKIKEGWVSRIDARHAAGKRIVVWGGGSKAVSFLTTLVLMNRSTSWWKLQDGRE